MDLDHPRTILYVILHKLIQDDFKPRNDTYKQIMHDMFKQLQINEPSRPQEKKAQGTTKSGFNKEKKQATDPTRNEDSA